MRQRRIMVIEDEEHILEVISYNLKREGYAVSQARNGEEGLAGIRRERPDLIVLDIMLPGIDGLEICRRLKTDPALQEIPIIMVTAKTEESDIVVGLGVGADDYLGKPFSPRELVARVKAALRRGRWQSDRTAGTLIAISGLRIDVLRHEATLDNHELQLTPSEFRLLHFLASNPGRVYTREELLEYTASSGPYVLERNVDTHIKMLRKKLGSRQHLIETVRGVGYRFKDSGR
jgi:two-component system alkaline phosphatase synthesis response regulator PhoP